MGRIRAIKPSFFKDYELWQLDKETGLPCRLCYEALWCAADRLGRFEWKLPELRVEVMPYDDFDAFSRVIDALRRVGKVVVYVVDGREIGWLPKFEENQVVNHRESASTLPPPPKSVEKQVQNATREPRANDASSTREGRDTGKPGHASGEGKGTGREQEGNRKDKSPTTQVENYKPVEPPLQPPEREGPERTFSGGGAEGKPTAEEQRKLDLGAFLREYKARHDGMTCPQDAIPEHLRKPVAVVLTLEPGSAVGSSP